MGVQSPTEINAPRGCAVILKQLEEKEPLPDKEADQMAWVRAANQHRVIAEEIILKELNESWLCTLYVWLICLTPFLVVLHLSLFLFYTSDSTAETLREQYRHILLFSFFLRESGNGSKESFFDCHSLFTPPIMA